MGERHGDFELFREGRGCTVKEPTALDASFNHLGAQ
jgi:hypothetical protein